jgi:hypothetical protein
MLHLWRSRGGFVSSHAFALLASGSIEFEVLESDAELLLAHTDTLHVFYINDETGVFTARLSPFVSAISTHPGLALMRDRPILRGRLGIIETVPS